MRFENAPAVTFGDMIDRREKFWLFRQFAKPLLHTILVFQRLIEAEQVDAKIENVFKICIGSFR